MHLPNAKNIKHKLNIMSLYCPFQAILLKEAHALLSPELFTPHPLSTDPEEMELAVEIRLLMSNINMQQGRMSAR